jgi:hypothetical protein
MRKKLKVRRLNAPLYLRGTGGGRHLVLLALGLQLAVSILDEVDEVPTFLLLRDTH